MKSLPIRTGKPVAHPFLRPSIARRSRFQGDRVQRIKVLESFIDVLHWESIMECLVSWAEARNSRYVCMCNVHSVVTARIDAKLRKAHANADLCAADGMPLVWIMRKRGFPGQDRINGPDLMLRYLEEAQRLKHRVFFYGGSPETAQRLGRALRERLPLLRIAGLYSPPFRPLTAEEDRKIMRIINNSGAHVVFVGLGCPKQEIWMAGHKGKVRAVMVGVGAAFDFMAGAVDRAPRIMQELGLEWMHRLVSEPGRLWKRYLVTNSIFLRYHYLELLGLKKVTGGFKDN